MYLKDPDAIRIVESLPQKVGIFVDGGILTILPEGQKVDVEVSSPVFNTCDNADFFTVNVYQGEWETNQNLTMMGTFNVPIAQPGPRGANLIVLKFTYCSDCIVRIKAYINDSLVQTAELMDRWSNMDLKTLRKKYDNLLVTLDENIQLRNKRLALEKEATSLLEWLQNNGGAKVDVNNVMRIRSQLRSQERTLGILNEFAECLISVKKKYPNK